MDEKWIDALRPYWGGGIVPTFPLEDHTVDAQKTIDHLMRSRGQMKIGPDGDYVPWPA